MTRHSARGLLVAVVVVLLVASTATAAVAVFGADAVRAQDDATETTTDESATASDAQNESESEEVVREVDSTIRVTGYSYDDENETFRINFENTGDRSKRVTIAESPAEDAIGDSRIGIKTVTVRPGQTLITDVRLYTERDNPGVMVTTDESVQQGYGTYLAVESEDDDGGLFTGVPTWVDVWMGIGASIAGMAVVSVLGVWHVVARESNDVAEVSLE